MAQWDIHRNGSTRSRGRVPYLLDMQSDSLRAYRTRVIVPLYLLSAFGTPARVLNPLLTVDGLDVVAAFDELATVPLSVLGDVVGRAEAQRSALVAALDRLFLDL